MAGAAGYLRHRLGERRAFLRESRPFGGQSVERVLNRLLVVLRQAHQAEELLFVFRAHLLPFLF